MAAQGVAVDVAIARLTDALLGRAALPHEWVQTPRVGELVDRAIGWVHASLDDTQRVRATVVRVGLFFDSLLDNGVIDAPDLAGFFRQLFVSIVSRGPMPDFGDPQVANALQLVADLFVDAVNRDEGVLALSHMQLDLMAIGARRPLDVIVYLHDKASG